MRRTFECGTKARLSFSGRPHAPVNMTDSMANVGSWTVLWIQRGDGSPEVLQGFGIRNIAQYSAANTPFPAFFSPFIHFFHTIRHVYRSAWPAREAKPCVGAALECSVHDCETRLSPKENNIQSGPPRKSSFHSHQMLQNEKEMHTIKVLKYSVLWEPGPHVKLKGPPQP